MTTYVPLNDALEEILICAERYACGRRTYVVSDTVNYIISYTSNLSNKTLQILLDDMKTMAARAQRSGQPEIWGDPCDLAEWMRLTDAVTSEMSRRAAAPPPAHLRLKETGNEP